MRSGAPRMAFGLRVRQAIATSPLARPVAAALDLAGRLRLLGRPELGLLQAEGRMIAALLCRIVQPHWNCMDVGGHIGSVAWQLQRLARHGKLAIVEASPAKAAALRRRFPHAEVHAVAVSDHDGRATFYENRDAPGFSSLTDRSERGRTVAVEVPVTRLDTLWPADRPLHFLKIDVEGHEPAALRGAAGLIGRHKPVILFEAGAVTDTDGGAAGYDTMFDDLTGMGYAIRPVFHHHHGREPVSAEGFRACRLYPFTAFNFLATQG